MTELEQLTGSGSTTSILLSHPSAASPATQDTLSNILLSHSCTSPDFTHLGSESGRSVSRCATRIIWQGMGPWLNVGRVGSAGEELSEGKVGRGAYDFVVSDRPSIYDDSIISTNDKNTNEEHKPRCLSAHYHYPSQR